MNIVAKLVRLLPSIGLGCLLTLRSVGASADVPSRPSTTVSAPRTASSGGQVALRLPTTNAVVDAQAICAHLGAADAATFECARWQRTRSAGDAVREFRGKTCDPVKRLPALSVPANLEEQEIRLLDSCHISADDRLRVLARSACSNAQAAARDKAEKTTAAAKKAQELAKADKKPNLKAAAAANDAAKVAAEAKVLNDSIQAKCQDEQIAQLTCATRGPLTDDLRKLDQVEAATKADTTICGSLSSPPLDPASVGTIALQALGDYLKDIAKQELVEYALDHLGRDFCKNDSPFEGNQLFPITCKAVFPNGTDEDADTSVILDGKLPALLVQDVDQLPVVVVLKLLNQNGSPGFRTLLTEVLGDLIPQITTKQDVLTLLANLRDDGRKATASNLPDHMPKTCNFSGTALQPPECVMALFLEIAGAAKESFAASGNVSTTSVEHWLEVASTNFCANYSTSADGSVPTDGSCVYGASADFWSSLSNWTQSVLTLYEQLASTRASASSAVTAAGRFSVEIQPLINTETGDAFLVFFGKCLDTFEALSKADATWAPGGNKDKLVRSSADLVAGAIGKDAGRVLADIKDIAVNPIVSARVDANVVRAVTFVAAIAQAKTRDDARQVIEDVAAPLGTWKAKFAANTVMINGYVGPFGLLRTPLTKHDGDPAYVAMDHSVLRGLSAPVGVEFSHRFDSHWHAGIAVLLLDPLQLRVEQRSGVYHTDFRDVLTPGLLAHLSIYNSPIDLVIGAQIQPLSRSTETCSNDHACWRAPLSGMVGLAVDAPLLQLQ